MESTTGAVWQAGDPVLVTTAHRGVFFGRFKAMDEQRGKIVLTAARCAIRWATTGGFLELASIGPNSKSKIGTPAEEIELWTVTSVTRCTPGAATAWEAAR